MLGKRREPMNLNQHLKALEYRHNQLDKIIANENRRPLPDYLCIRELKQKKLHLKEMIYSLKN
jgi:hypothetical protein